MADNIRIVIADDNVQVCTLLRLFFSAQPGCEVVGQAADGIETLEVLRNNKADVLLLDMIMPRLDGIGVLERLATEEWEDVPQTIVLTALGQEEIVRKATDLGARYYMIKPFDLDVLHKRVQEAVGQRIPRKAVVPPQIVQRSMDEKITSIFLMIGIPAHIKGYHYLREGVRLVVEQPDMINRITKELYPSIARAFETSASKVERAIRHAIEVAWSRGKMENINQVFGYSVYTKDDKPTNGEFIALISDKLIMDNAS